jgi:hypothetical protein
VTARMPDPRSVSSKVASLLLVAAWTAVGCQGGGARGVVRDGAGRPVVGATVTWVDGQDVASATTGGDGTFQVRMEAAGPIGPGTLKVSAAGYKTVIEPIWDGPYECTVTLKAVASADDSAAACRSMD